ncbi:MAG: fatty acid desaturase [Chloroflexi bacterium]|nr:fatty acid desaturase [Chloroflexota bacterium]
MQETTAKKTKPTWVRIVAAYQKPAINTSIIQILNSYVPFWFFLILACVLVNVSLLLSLPCSLLAAGFMMRVFIIQHDAGHGSFFKSKKWNTLVGNLCSIVTLTPYDMWRTNHAIHHAHNGDLNHRGTGDIYTMTVNEYRELPALKRFGYKMYRNPAFLFIIGAPMMFLVLFRFPFAYKHTHNRRGIMSIIRTDLQFAAFLVLMSLGFGVGNFLLAYFPMIFFASSAGVWMFYVQHQFEDAYWSKDPHWTYEDAALKGSTYYKLPKVLQWFTGNIGLHHIHHLSPLIPNYLLQECHDENPEFQQVVTLTIWSSVKLVAKNLALWDEATEKMMTFREFERNERLARQLNRTQATHG